MNVNDVIAQNVRAARERKKLTLDGAAELTGVSRSMLAQIEKGEVNPTISVLWKIANGYKVSFTSLVEERGGRYLNSPLFPFDETTLFETYRIVIKPRGSLAAQPHLAGSEEYITLFSGAAEIQVGEETFSLAKGDSIRFRADVPHSYRNPGDETTELSMLIYYGR